MPMLRSAVHQSGADDALRPYAKRAHYSANGTLCVHRPLADRETGSRDAKIASPSDALLMREGSVA